MSSTLFARYLSYCVMTGLIYSIALAKKKQREKRLENAKKIHNLAETNYLCCKLKNYGWNWLQT